MIAEAAWDLFNVNVPQSGRVEDMSRGVALEAISTYTYRTPHWQLSGAQDYKPGSWTGQVHIWQATLDRDAYVFTTYPGGLEGDYMAGDWTGGFVPHLSVAADSIPFSPGRSVPLPADIEVAPTQLDFGDVIVHSSGSIFFTDPPYGINPEDSEIGFNGLYRLDPDGRMALLSSDFGSPKGRQPRRVRLGHIGMEESDGQCSAAK